MDNWPIAENIMYSLNFINEMMKCWHSTNATIFDPLL